LPDLEETLFFTGEDLFRRRILFRRRLLFRRKP